MGSNLFIICLWKRNHDIELNYFMYDEEVFYSDLYPETRKVSQDMFL